MIKKIFFMIVLSSFCILNHKIYATSLHGVENDFYIIPKVDESKYGDENGSTQIINNIADTRDGNNVIDNYTHEYEKIKGDLGMQMKTGVMGRSTILDYMVYLVRFLSQIGILIGGVMIVYAGYLYGSNIFTGKAGDAKKAIKNAIIGIIIIIFSYVIMKTLTSMFL